MVAVVPTDVGEASRRWDDEHLDLVAAGETIGSAPTDGFTGAVAGHASSFVSSWQQFATEAGTACEGTADGLRTSIRAFLAADDGVHRDLAAFLTELR